MLTQNAFVFRWNKQKSAWEAWEGLAMCATMSRNFIDSLCGYLDYLNSHSLDLKFVPQLACVFGGNRDVRLLAEMEGDGGHVISINQGLLFLLWGRSPWSSSRLAKRHWMHERPGMKWNLHPMVMQGEEVIMTSYQELTAGGESSLLFTGCCRAKEVTDRDLDCRTRAELGDEAGRPQF